MPAIPLPVWLAITYLVVNLGLMIWVERARAAGRAPAGSFGTLVFSLRWGPPIAGLIYLETRAGDWLFVALVACFFGLALWLADGLLSQRSGPPSP